MLWKILDFHVACCSRSDNSEGPFCLVVFNVVGLSCPQQVISGFNLVQVSLSFSLLR